MQPDLPDREASKVTRVTPDHKDPLAQPVQLDLLELKATKVTQAKLVSKDQPAQQG